MGTSSSAPAAPPGTSEEGERGRETIDNIEWFVEVYAAASIATTAVHPRAKLYYTYLPPYAGGGGGGLGRGR